MFLLIEKINFVGITSKLVLSITRSRKITTKSPMSIIPQGKPIKPQSIKNIPKGMSLSEWLKLKDKEKKDRVNQRLDGRIYERDLSLLSKDSDDF